MIRFSVPSRSSSTRLLRQWQRSRQFSAKTTSEETKPILGISYEKLTVGIPKETFPLEKRVAATPEVRVILSVCHNFLSCGNHFAEIPPSTV